MDEEKRERSVFEKLEGKRTASQSFERLDNSRLDLLGSFAPDTFYKWPLWKKLLLAIPAAILLVAFLALRGMFLGGGY